MYIPKNTHTHRTTCTQARLHRARLGVRVGCCSPLISALPSLISVCHHRPISYLSQRHSSQLRWTIFSISAGSPHRWRKLSRNHRRRHRQASMLTPTRPSLPPRTAPNPTIMAPRPHSLRLLLASHRHRWSLPPLHPDRCLLPTMMLSPRFSRLRPQPSRKPA